MHHRHVLPLPSTFLNEPDDVDGEVKMIAAKAYSIKNFWYVDYEVVAPDAKRLQYQVKQTLAGNTVVVRTKSIPSVSSAPKHTGSGLLQCRVT